MRVYIATRFDWWERAAEARRLLHEAGHVVTSRWIDEARRLDGRCDAVPIGDPRRAANAEMDLTDLQSSDAILVIVPPAGGTGMWLELGVAIGVRPFGSMRILMAGPAEERTIFAELPDVEVYKSIADAVAALGTVAP